MTAPQSRESRATQTVATADKVIHEFSKEENRYCFWDFFVTVENVEFKCHKFVLNACSGFFKHLFLSGMKESRKNSTEIYGISSELFSLILDFLYSTKDVLTEHNIFEIWRAAHFLDIRFLVDICEKFIQLNVDNCLLGYKYATMLQCDTLLRKALEVITSNFDEVSSSSYIALLESRDFKKIIQNDNLNVSHEDNVIKAILKWVKYNPSDDVKVSKVEQCFLFVNYINKRAEVGGSQADCGDSHEDTGQSDNNKSDNSPDNEQLIGCGSEEATNCLKTSDETMLPEKEEKRKERLPTLLESSRICFVSNECIDMLLSTDLVRQSKDACDIVRRANRFSHHREYWPSYALQRTNSKKSVVGIFACEKEIKVYDMSTGKHSVVDSYAFPFTAINVINNDVFFRSTKDELLCRFSKNDLRQSLTNLSLSQSLFFVYSNGYVYLHTEQMHICRFNYELIYGQKAPPLTKVASFPDEFDKKKLRSTATHGKHILFFFEETESVSQVLSLNCQTFEITTLPKIDGPASNLVSFGDGQSTWILVTTGQLYVIRGGDLQTDNCMSFEIVSKLWEFSWHLHGALIFKKTLFVFGDELKNDADKESIQKVYENVPKSLCDNINAVQIKSGTPVVSVLTSNDWVNSQ